jgi:hypothetical protein
MYRRRGTASIVGVSRDTYYSISMTPLSTVLRAAMIMAQYPGTISTVAIWCMSGVIAPLAFLLAFMILLWAGAFWWRCGVLIAQTISLEI